MAKKVLVDPQTGEVYLMSVVPARSRIVKASEPFLKVYRSFLSAVIADIQRKALSKIELILLFYILNEVEQSDRNEIILSTEVIAKTLGVSKRYVQKGLKKLRELGYLEEIQGKVYKLSPYYATKLPEDRKGD